MRGFNADGEDGYRCYVCDRFTETRRTYALGADLLVCADCYRTHEMRPPPAPPPPPLSKRDTLEMPVIDYPPMVPQ